MLRGLEAPVFVRVWLETLSYVLEWINPSEHLLNITHAAGIDVIGNSP